MSRILFDFIAQIENKMEIDGITKTELAKRLSVTQSAVSQILNNSKNMSLETAIKYARAVGLKVSVVAYDDADPENYKGLINAEIFIKCWERQGKPIDYFDLEEEKP
jgi:transcriptional regulator with XRE-family HTH domain